MKKIIILLIIGMAFSVNVLAQPTIWQWADGAGGGNNGSPYSYGVANDLYNDVYIGGSFYDTITFENTTLINTGDSGTTDGFLAKYTSSGNLAWAKKTGGNFSEGIRSLITDSYGNLYYAGNFGDSSTTMGSFNLTNTNPYTADIYLAKCDTAGNVIWALSEGGGGDEQIYSMCTDAAGNIYLSVSFYSVSITIDTMTFVNAMNGSADILLIKYDSAGNVMMATAIHGTFHENAADICTDTGGNIYITGFFQSPVLSFGSTTITNVNPPNSDFFIAKFDVSGNCLWAIGAGGSNYEQGDAIAIDANNNVSVLGNFRSDTFIVGSNVLVNVGTNSRDFFVAEYDSSGSNLWAQRGGSETHDYGLGFCLGASGSIYMAGLFTGDTMTVGTDTLFNLSLINNLANLFVVKFNTAGAVLWTQQAGGYNSGANCKALSINTAGELFVTGEFVGQNMHFGSTTLVQTSAYQDVYIAKLVESLITISEDTLNSSLISILPNPVTNQLTVSSRQWAVKEIEIYDILGQRVFSQKLTANSQELTVDVSFLNSGIYFVKMCGEREERVAKFVKE